MKVVLPFAVGVAALMVLVLALSSAAVTSHNTRSTEGSVSIKSREDTKLATFGSGCFWCTEAVFERLEGVIQVVSGYSGGTTENPTYHEVTTGSTGHAEVIQIEYDPALVSYEELLDLFWKSHDPTTLNRQGADVGTQYRSIVLYHDEQQRVAAEASKDAAQAQFERPIVTSIERFSIFYRAEEYHQDYYAKNPGAGYCVFVIRPKLEKLEKLGI